MQILPEITDDEAMTLGVALRALAKHAPDPATGALLAKLGQQLIGGSGKTELRAILDAARTWALADVAADVAADHFAQLVRAGEFRRDRSERATGEHLRQLRNADSYLERTSGDEQRALHALHRAATAALAPHERERKFGHHVAAMTLTGEAAN